MCIFLLINSLIANGVSSVSTVIVVVVVVHCLHNYISYYLFEKLTEKLTISVRKEEEDPAVVCGIRVSLSRFSSNVPARRRIPLASWRHCQQPEVEEEVP